MKKVLIALALTGFFVASCGGDKKPAQDTTTTTTQETTPAETTPEPAKPAIPADIETLLDKHTCLTCHKMDEKLVGPAYTEVAMRNYSDEAIVELIYNPKPDNWEGYPPMIGLKDVPKEDAMKIAGWINSLND